eukprot:CAMPEP_0175547378 /NCGR_PEP_ID=MMETSP0096-20121207/30262_1 /TAXON_ID=311494 /ORGANISM="Alexandrium monilatum, Strain CCMP3105" /LENGTH=581 /DNA_ID=CAMNT_0016850361 /DNA_START=23 /DNA_END=1768 /DNA_ORIENTATION=-
MAQRAESKPILSHGASTASYDGSAPEAAHASSFGAPEAENRGIFPLEPFHFLPPGVLVVIPTHLKKVQCLSHLVLLLGLLTSAGLAIDTIVNWSRWGCRTTYCQGRILPLVFVAFSLFYFLRTVEQFDEDLVVKQKEIEKAKDDLGKSYTETVAELDACVAKSMDTQATLAERNFDAKRRDFQRFMSKVVKDHAPGHVVDNALGGSSLLHEFRRFVVQWLQVFSECAIDPVAKPLRPVTAQELDACGSIREVAGLVSDRLRAMQVKFISTQLDRDKKEISSFRSVWDTMTQAQAKSIESKRKSVAGGPRAFRDEETGVMSFEGGLFRPDPKKEDTSLRWFQVGKSSQMCDVKKDSADETGFPVELHFCRCRCVFLSCEHLQLVLAVFVGVMIMYVEMFVAGYAKWALEANVCVCVVCVLFVLYEFVNLDIVKHLEMQLQDVLKEKERLEEKRAAMLDFYSKAQHLAEVWLHRTVPRLDILKQFSEELEDSLEEKDLPLLQSMNASMAALEHSLPALPLWLATTIMDEKTRRTLGEAMTTVTRAAGIKESLALMPKCSSALAHESGRLLQAAIESGKGAEAK